VQLGRINNIYGSFYGAGFMWVQLYTTGAFFYQDGNQLRSSWADIRDTGSINIDSSRVVLTGPDVAPANLSSRLWRRVA
jgi:hypothetical protein